uniref:Glutaredoxin-related protein 5, mitochondrial n=1 Tax=Acrobeloides nanus TaxID=290746 RepID=A0A914C1G2_9BILA
MLRSVSFARTLFNSASFNAIRPLSSESARVLTPELKERIQKLVQSGDVVVFMKGTQNQPMCGFSRNVKLILDLHKVPFRDYNVLEDEELRAGIKEFSDWPTIPQIYVKGQFVGGSDIFVQMHQEHEIAKFFDEHGIPSKYSETKKPNA